MALASTILNRAENILDFNRNDIGIPGLESTQLLAQLNSYVKEYFASFEKSGEPNSKLARETGFALVTDTAVNNSSGILAGATSIILDDSSSFGSSGAIAMWGNDRPDYVEFGANDDATTLSTVTGVNFTHKDDSIVSLLLALPSNFDTFRSQIGYEDAVSVDGHAYVFTSGNPVRHGYSIYDNGTTQYLHFPRGLTGNVFVKYNIVPTVIGKEIDTVDIPVKDEDYAVWRLVQYAAPKLDRLDLLQEAKDQSFSLLESAHIRRNIGKRPQLRPMRRRRTFSRSDIF